MKKFLLIPMMLFCGSASAQEFGGIVHTPVCLSGTLLRADEQCVPALPVGEAVSPVCLLPNSLVYSNGRLSCSSETKPDCTIERAGSSFSISGCQLGDRLEIVLDNDRLKITIKQ